MSSLAGVSGPIFGKPASCFKNLKTAQTFDRVTEVLGILLERSSELLRLLFTKMLIAAMVLMVKN